MMQLVSWFVISGDEDIICLEFANRSILRYNLHDPGEQRKLELLVQAAGCRDHVMEPLVSCLNKLVGKFVNPGSMIE